MRNCARRRLLHKNRPCGSDDLELMNRQVQVRWHRSPHFGSAACSQGSAPWSRWKREKLPLRLRHGLYLFEIFANLLSQQSLSVFHGFSLRTFWLEIDAISQVPLRVGRKIEGPVRLQPSLFFLDQLQQPKSLGSVKRAAHGRLPGDLAVVRRRTLAEEQVHPKRISHLGGTMVDR